MPKIFKDLVLRLGARLAIAAPDREVIVRQSPFGVSAHPGATSAMKPSFRPDGTALLRNRSGHGETVLEHAVADDQSVLDRERDCEFCFDQLPRARHSRNEVAPGDGLLALDGNRADIEADRFNILS